MKKFGWIGALLLALGVISAQAFELKNGNFSEGFAGWELKKDADILKSCEDFHILELGSGNVLRIDAEPSTAPVWRALRQSVEVKEGDIIEFDIDLRLEHPLFGHGSFLMIAFTDKNGGDLGFVGGEPCTNIDGVWTELSCHAAAPEGATTAVLEIVMHGQGNAYFKNAHAGITGSVIPQPLRGSVKVDVSEKVTCDSLWGFGFEDDGWFYNELNRQQGITEAEYQLNRDRIEWLQPNWVRMFFWHKEWCPSSDGETFTFESDGMQSHYKTLELYQRMNVPVVFAGTRWGVTDLYTNPEAFAKSVGAMFDYLHNEKGLTCVKYWSLLNEPNLDLADHGPVSFAQYVELHHLVKAEFKRRGLDVKIIGSDDGASSAWFDRCVFDQPYYDLVDVMCSHTYFRPAEALLSDKFIAKRTDRLAQQTVRKPFIVGEYGFHDVNMSSHVSTVMNTFGYGIRNAEFCINLLNLGGAGASIWTSHAAYYADTPKLMDFGLWRYKDSDWAIRPVYHSVAMFSRKITTGDKAYETISSHPRRFKMARAGNTLFWVNMSDKKTPVQISGFDADVAVVMTEKNIKGDRECGDVVKLKGNTFIAPPLSFGYIKAK